ncbi:MAG: COX15/CtaA family protein [Haloferacaceae archaeon]
MRDRLRATLTFPRFAALTTTMTLTLVSLGVYTAATGSGLACSAQWPLCDGGVLPQTVPSFIEWFHRLVAMVTGFLIVGTAGWAWRAADRRTAATATVAAVLLPLQVSIGAVTVTLGGMVPGGYSPPVQGAHLLVALAIFTALTVTTLRAFADQHVDSPVERAGRALATALVVLVAAALFSRLLPVVTYAPASQAAFFGVTLALFATLVGAVRWLGLAGRPLDRGLAGLAAACVVVAMVLGRDLVAYTPTLRLVNAAAFVVAFLAVALAAWRVREAASRTHAAGAVGD